MIRNKLKYNCSRFIIIEAIHNVLLNTDVLISPSILLPLASVVNQFLSCTFPRQTRPSVTLLTICQAHFDIRKLLVEGRGNLV